MVGDTIFELRTKKRWSRKRLSQESGTNNKTLWKIETGLSSPKLSTIESIATALGMKAQLFFEAISDNSHHEA